MRVRVDSLLVLRFGLAFVYVYASISAFLTPYYWVGFIPLFLRKLFPPLLLLDFFKIFELFLSAWLLSGKRLEWAGIVSALTGFLIILFNLKAFDVVFRDVLIITSSVAIFLQAWNKEKS